MDSFALAAGLASAVSSSSVIALAVSSELVAGAISMGLGGYLSGRVEADTHEAERLREHSEVEEKPWEEENEVVELLGHYGLNRAQCEPVLERFRQNKELWGRWTGRGQGRGEGGREQRERVRIAGRFSCGGVARRGCCFFAAFGSVTWILVSAVCRRTDPSCLSFSLSFHVLCTPLLWSHRECPIAVYLLVARAFVSVLFQWTL